MCGRSKTPGARTALPRRLLVTAMSALLALTVSVSGVARAETGSPPADGAGPDPLDQEIDVELKDADVRQTLESFGAVLQPEEVRIDPDLGGKVSLQLDDVRVRTVLDALCDSVGCVWRLTDERVLVFERRPDRAAEEEESAGGPAPAAVLDRPIDLALEDADVGRVFEAFARMLGAELDLGAGVDGTLTIQLDGVPVRQALDRACLVQGCAWTLSDPGGPEPVLRIRASE